MKRQRGAWLKMERMSANKGLGRLDWEDGLESDGQDMRVEVCIYVDVSVEYWVSRDFVVLEGSYG